MNKLLQKIIIVGVGVSMLVACSADNVDEEMTTLNATTSAYKLADISANELVGKWVLDSMTANVGVDLNLDKVSNTNVLSETSCFNEMYFDFQADGSIDTKQARLYFITDSGAMECNSKLYGATYAVNGDQLMVTFDFNGTAVTESKTISLLTNEDGQFLKVSLEYYETEGYIPENPTTQTGAENVDLLEIVYKKV